MIADSIRLRLTRNRIQHGRLGTTRRGYRDLYKVVKQPLIRLGCPSHELKQLTPSFKYGIPNATPNFVGRDTELAHIHKTFIGNTKPAAVVIIGLPGIGKSELANQYCQKYGDEYDHIIFINGDSIDASLQDIAKILELHNTTDITVIVKLLEEYFRNEKVLFVYDNVTDTSALANVLIRDFKNIVTTQIQNWGDPYEKITLEVWTEIEALQYLAKSHLNQQEQGDLQLLAEKLGYHPLAIEHATSFIKQSAITLQEYFEFLQDHKLQVLSEKVTLDQSGIKTSIFTSFLLTIQKLQKENPEAFRLLSILGILDGSFIYEPFIRGFCEKNWQYTRIKTLLNDYSMIKCKKRVSEWNGQVTDYLTIHSLYQQAVLFSLQDQNLISQTVESCLERICTDKDKNNDYGHKENIQFLYLWEQPSLQNVIIEFFETNPFSMKRFLVTGTKWYKSFKDLFIRIKDKHKDNIHNILLYWAKLLLIMVVDYSYENIIKVISALRNEINFNINIGTDKEKMILLSTCDNLLPSTSNGIALVRYISFVHQGLYELFVEFENIYRYKGVCYKELGKYDEALKILLTDTEGGVGWSLSKVHISCCYILKGEVEKGIGLLDLIPELDLDNCIDIGRAFYDVGWNDKSKEYFDKSIAIIESNDGRFGSNPGHCMIDGFCKMMLLKEDSHTLSLLLSLANTLSKFEGEIPYMDGQLRFRWFTFISCCYIQKNEVVEAFNQVQTLVALHTEKKSAQKELCFREVFFLASKWKAQGYYYKALTTYRIVEMFRRELKDVPELFLHDFNNVDVSNEMEICSTNLIRIFKFLATGKYA